MKTLLLLSALTLVLASLSVNAERLTDKYGRTIGNTRTDSSGKVTMSDAYGRTTGSYNPKTNATTDKYGRTIGNGNQLSSTLPPRQK